MELFWTCGWCSKTFTSVDNIKSHLDAQIRQPDDLHKSHKDDIIDLRNAQKMRQEANSRLALPPTDVTIFSDGSEQHPTGTGRSDTGMRYTRTANKLRQGTGLSTPSLMSSTQKQLGPGKTSNTQSASHRTSNTAAYGCA
jgi:hypothetical protein